MSLDPWKADRAARTVRSHHGRSKASKEAQAGERTVDRFPVRAW